MAHLSKTTKDHEEIRRWAEERGGTPSHVKNTGSAEDIGILRIDFPGFGGEGSLEPISWEEWFEKFDQRGLALLYQEETAEGQRSNFNKIVSSETAEEAETASHGGSTSRAKRSASERSTKKGAKRPATTAAKASSRSAGEKRSTSARPAAKGAKKSAAKSSSAVAKRSGQKSTPSAATRSAARRTASSRPIKKASAKKAPIKKAPIKKAPVKKSAAKRRR